MALAAKKPLSVKDRLAAMKAAKNVSAKTVKKETVKETKKVVGKGKVVEKKTVTGSKGRPKGIKYVLPDEHQEVIGTQFAEIETTFKELDNSLNKFVESGNKSAAKVARGAAQALVKSCKILRKQISEGKEGLVAEEV